MTENLNKTPHFPFTYGDGIKNEGKRFSDSVVNKLKEKKFQRHVGALILLILSLGSQVPPVKGIPTEYGEAANEMLNQAGAAVPPIGKIKRQVPVPQGNPQCFIPAMPIEQQRLIAAQQAGQGMPIGEIGPTNPPAFYIPGKPKTTLPRALNTLVFTSTLEIICLNAAWSQPVAIMICSS
jgi:hypothetical protein